MSLMRIEGKPKTLGYPRELWILAIGAVISMTGFSFLWPLNTIYIHQVLGKSVSVAGLVLMGFAGFGVLGSFLGGYLHDRIGGKRTIIIGTLICLLSVLTMAFYKEWIGYIVLLSILGFGFGVTSPAQYALCKSIWPEGGRRAFNLLYVSQNVGVAVGSALGGIVAQASFTLVFLANALTFLIYFVIIQFGLSDRAESKGVEGESMETSSPVVSSSPFEVRTTVMPLIFLCTGFFLCWVTYVQWSTMVPTLMSSKGLPISAYSLLWTINGAMIIAIQPISGFITKRLLPTLKLQLLAGVVLFCLSILILSWVNVYSGFIIGMIVMTIGEIFVWPAVPTAAAELAPKDRLGMYQGVVGGIGTAGRMVGPLIGGVLYDFGGPQLMLYTMLGIGIVAMLFFVGYAKVSFKKDPTSL